MFHPLAGNLSELTDQELEKKLNELTTKYVKLPLTCDPNLRNQLMLLLETHRQELISRTYKKQNNNKKDGPDPFASLDIS